MERELGEEEARKILKRMPQEKAHRIDGMTLEVLSAYWSFLQKDFMAMLIHYWQIGDLNRGTTVGVMKLTPKKVDNHHLED